MGEAPDFVPCVEKAGNESPTHVTGSACYQYPHRASAGFVRAAGRILVHQPNKVAAWCQMKAINVREVW